MSGHPRLDQAITAYNKVWGHNIDSNSVNKIRRDAISAALDAATEVDAALLTKLLEMALQTKLFMLATNNCLSELVSVLRDELVARNSNGKSTTST